MCRHWSGFRSGGCDPITNEFGSRAGFVDELARGRAAPWSSFRHAACSFSALAFGNFFCLS